MSAFFSGLLVTYLPQIMLGIAGLVGTAVTWVCARIAQQFHVNITDALRRRVQDAIVRAIQTLLAKHIASGGSIRTFDIKKAVQEAAMMVLQSNPTSTKKIGATQQSLVNTAYAVSTVAASSLGVSAYEDVEAVKALLQPSTGTRT